MDFSDETFIDAYTDKLTGLNNKNYYARVQRHIAVQMIKDLTNSDKKIRKVWSVLYCDANNLKDVNDIYGHQAGNDGLTALGTIIKKTKENAIRSQNRDFNDIIITPFGEEKGGIQLRIGGDEFLIILPDCNKYNAQIVKERINKLIYSSLKETKGITLAIGIADTTDVPLPSSIDDEKEVEAFLENLIKLAETQMYKEKIVDIKVMSLDGQLDLIDKKLARMSNIGLDFNNPEHLDILAGIINAKKDRILNGPQK